MSKPLLYENYYKISTRKLLYIKITTKLPSRKLKLQTLAPVR